MLYFIKKCLLCGVEISRWPLPKGYGKGCKALENRDVVSHCYCDKCVKKLDDKGEIKKDVDKR